MTIAEAIATAESKSPYRYDVLLVCRFWQASLIGQKCNSDDSGVLHAIQGQPNSAHRARMSATM